MPKINKDYSTSGADSLFNSYIIFSGLNPIIKTRKTNTVYCRTLLYKILIDCNDMNQRQVAEYFLIKGLKINRSSITNALKKIDIYYRDFSGFRKLYDACFNDKVQEYKIQQEKKEQRVIDLNNAKPKILAKDKKDALSIIIKDIPLDRREEIYNLIEMRIKSWAWKSKDKCEIIEASSGISLNTF
jgi:hypothetical protein